MTYALCLGTVLFYAYLELMSSVEPQMRVYLFELIRLCSYN